MFLLLVSRIIYSDPNGTIHKFGIVDTDDDVEEIVDWNLLYYICFDLCLDIRGITYYDENGIKFIDTITPQQVRGTMTQLQTKTLALKSVRVVTYKDCVSAIVWDFDDLRSTVSIRLSEFGKACSDSLLLYRHNSLSNRLILVLDDNIDFSETSFVTREYSEFSSLGVVFDIREVHRIEKAELVYECVRNCGLFDSLPASEVIIDNSPRFDSFSIKYGLR